MINPLYIMVYIAYMVLLFVVFKEKIYKQVYGDRFIKYHILDTGEHGYKIRNKGVNTIQDNEGNDRVFNRQRLFNGIQYYMYDCAEPVNLCFNPDKVEYFPDTDEFNIILYNKAIERFLAFHEAKMIQTIFYVTLITGGLVFYVIYKLNKFEEMTLSELAYFKDMVTNVIKVNT